MEDLKEEYSKLQCRLSYFEELLGIYDLEKQFIQRLEKKVLEDLDCYFVSTSEQNELKKKERISRKGEQEVNELETEMNENKRESLKGLFDNLKKIEEFKFHSNKFA